MNRAAAHRRALALGLAACGLMVLGARAQFDLPLQIAADEPIVDEEPAEKVCPVCGVASSGKYCPECGAPMGRPEE